MPNNPAEMRQAIADWQSQLNQLEVTRLERIRLLGLIGSYARILKEFKMAFQALTTAVEEAEAIKDERLKVVNQIRLATVYQWQQDYMTSDALFAAAIAQCHSNPALTHYLDFAYQHFGKSKFDQNQYDDAQRYFQHALELRQQKGDRELVASTKLAIATVDQRRGRAD